MIASGFAPGLEFGHFQASRSDRRMVAVGNAHGLHGFLGWRRGATYDP
jgi:hypothetical protein